MFPSDYRYHNNPNYQRLTKSQPRFRFSILINCGFILFVVPSSCFLSSLALPMLIPMYYFIISGTSMVFALFLGFFLTWFVASDCRRPDFELILLTPQSNRAIFDSYWYAYFDRLERYIDFPVETLGKFLAIPNAVMMMVWILVVGLGDPIPIIEINIWQWSFAKLILFFMATMLLTVSSFRLLPMMGIVLALLIRRVTLAMVGFLATSVVILGLWFGVSYVLFDRWEQWLTPRVDNYDGVLVLAIILTILVYILRGGLWFSLNRYLRSMP